MENKHLYYKVLVIEGKQYNYSIGLPPNSKEDFLELSHRYLDGKLIRGDYHAEENKNGAMVCNCPTYQMGRIIASDEVTTLCDHTIGFYLKDRVDALSVNEEVEF